MINILLLEDEDYTRKFLKKLVSENSFVHRIYDTPSGQEAISLAGKYKPDIALLDIELAPEEDLNGIQAAKTIYHSHPETHFVFITGYSQYAIESFAVHPYDYILKPVQKDKIHQVINSLAVRFKKNKGDRSGPRKIMLKAGNEIFLIATGDILFIEKQGKFTFIHADNSIYKTSQAIGNFEDKLGDNFLRVHRSFIANMDKIKRIRNVSNRSYEIIFDGYDKVALMSRYKFEEHQHRFTPL